MSRLRHGALSSVSLRHSFFSDPSAMSVRASSAICMTASVKHNKQMGRTTLFSLRVHLNVSSAVRSLLEVFTMDEVLAFERLIPEIREGFAGLTE